MTEGLVVEDLTFAYRPGAAAVLDGMSARFEPGTVTVVTGASGRGKSTLLYLLGMLLRPTSGRLRWGDVDLTGADDRTCSRIRAERIGFVFQDALLDPARTILDNVLEGGLYAGLTGPVGRARAHDLLEQFGVRARVDHRPGEISGGQAQRVALCRALIKEPLLLLADEPTGNLDAESAAVVWQACADTAARGGTVVVATHDTSRAAGARHLVLA
ncbi:ABC transporter ATP-binding protein [Blastococcus sp. TF02-8]|uniref:ABC transporter ATP-binding protein n=1 Tax=Blastococcus sp. TF02-8 TaxID=2250574 RepID=UPI000DE839E8|nr:ATP-binding cassette domain-containing protein [Blastococcus sp. TF02-8]RBY97134.1 ABC transporter ATP-binding protein [Blastococcus sp. TF02-8]